MAQPDARSDILAPAPWVEERGAKIRITAVSTFLTAPHGCPHLVVRVETNEPGLYGLGCASDPQRTLAVRSVLDDYLAPMLVGRDPDDIDDIHRLLLNSAYWRGGSVTGNALGGVDVALWDLKAKRLGAPCTRCSAAGSVPTPTPTPMSAAPTPTRSPRRSWRRASAVTAMSVSRPPYPAPTPTAPPPPAPPTRTRCAPARCRGTPPRTYAPCHAS